MNEREVLAFDLHGTLVDPVTAVGGLGHLLSDVDGRTAAGGGGPSSWGTPSGSLRWAFTRTSGG